MYGHIPDQIICVCGAPGREHQADACNALYACPRTRCTTWRPTKQSEVRAKIETRTKRHHAPHGINRRRGLKP